MGSSTSKHWMEKKPKEQLKCTPGKSWREIKNWCSKTWGSNS